VIQGLSRKKTPWPHPFVRKKRKAAVTSGKKKGERGDVVGERKGGGGNQSSNEGNFDQSVVRQRQENLEDQLGWEKGNPLGMERG